MSIDDSMGRCHGEVKRGLAVEIECVQGSTILLWAWRTALVFRKSFRDSNRKRAVTCIGKSNNPSHSLIGYTVA